MFLQLSTKCLSLLICESYIGTISCIWLYPSVLFKYKIVLTPACWRQHTSSPAGKSCILILSDCFFGVIWPIPLFLSQGKHCWCVLHVPSFERQSQWLVLPPLVLRRLMKKVTFYSSLERFLPYDQKTVRVMVLP